MVITPATVFEPAVGQAEKRLQECGIPFWPHGFVTVQGDVEQHVRIQRIKQQGRQAIAAGAVVEMGKQLDADGIAAQARDHGVLDALR